MYLVRTRIGNDIFKKQESDPVAARLGHFVLGISAGAFKGVASDIDTIRETMSWAFRNNRRNDTWLDRAQIEPLRIRH